MYIVTIDEEKCQACSECIDVCSQSMIAMVEENGKKYAMFSGDPDDCLGCYSCQEMCDEGAIEITEY